MAIRIRVVDGITIAVCAARSIPMEGDVYLDDAQHYALTLKFGQDLEYFDSFDSIEYKLMDAAESNNSNRADWDDRFGVSV